MVVGVRAVSEREGVEVGELVDASDLFDRGQDVLVIRPEVTYVELV
jgi:hypothetical protein